MPSLQRNASLLYLRWIAGANGGVRQWSTVLRPRRRFHGGFFFGLWRSRSPSFGPTHLFDLHIFGSFQCSASGVGSLSEVDSAPLLFMLNGTACTAVGMIRTKCFGWTKGHGRATADGCGLSRGKGSMSEVLRSIGRNWGIVSQLQTCLDSRSRGIELRYHNGSWNESIYRQCLGIRRLSASCACPHFPNTRRWGCVKNLQSSDTPCSEGPLR